MEMRSVSRCVAIAAHGKRCQQSPFRGSPYCWHHTQSRKIWAPSRPLGAAPARPVSEALGEGRLGGERRSGVDRRSGDAAELAAHRIAMALGPEATERMLAFLEDDADGAFHLVREDGLLMDARTAPAADARGRRRASG
jgi:hypothetical protein